jgi:hypothetical protein
MRRLRSGVLAVTMAAFVPLAVPVTASASTFDGYTPPGDHVIYTVGTQFVNQVYAGSFMDGGTVFREKFQLGVGTGSTINAVNRAVAVASRCDGCSAVALGFQIVTTTVQDLQTIHAVNVADAKNIYCVDTCAAFADVFQVVVATDTPQPLTYGQLLSEAQLNGLIFIRTEFLALERSGLPLPVISAQCQHLVAQAVTILQDARVGGPGTGWPSYAAFTRPANSTAATQPAFSPAVPAASAGSGPSGSGRPVVNLYHDMQYRPFSAG